MSDTSVSLDILHTLFSFPPKSVCSLHMRNVKLLDTIDSGWPILILARVFPYTRPPPPTPPPSSPASQGLQLPLILVSCLPNKLAAWNL